MPLCQHCLQKIFFVLFFHPVWTIIENIFPDMVFVGENTCNYSVQTESLVQDSNKILNPKGEADWRNSCVELILDLNKLWGESIIFQEWGAGVTLHKNYNFLLEPFINK